MDAFGKSFNRQGKIFDEIHGLLAQPCDSGIHQTLGIRLEAVHYTIRQGLTTQLSELLQAVVSDMDMRNKILSFQLNLQIESLLCSHPVIFYFSYLLDLCNNCRVIIHDYRGEKRVKYLMPVLGKALLKKKNQISMKMLITKKSAF